MSSARALVVDAEVSLVPRQPPDAAEMFAVVDRNRAALREWLTWIDATRSVLDVRRYAQFAQAQFEQQTGFDYSLRERGAIVGAIGLHNVDWGSRSAQFGYWLIPAARGRGLMSRACLALTRQAFRVWELHRVEIRCVVENLPSRAVAERLNYTFEGTLREAYLLHGRYRDLALYAMTVTDLQL